MCYYHSANPGAPVNNVQSIEYENDFVFEYKAMNTHVTADS